MKKNITIDPNNILQDHRSILRHFTDKKRIILLVSSIILLGSISILSSNNFTNNTSALSYQSSTDIEFGITPSISVTVSGDLSIGNLALGSSNDSNPITVTVSTNNVNGYKLTATVGDNTHSAPSFNNTNLNHTNGTNTFTSLSPTDSYPTFIDDNIAPNTWGYSYSNDSGTTWSNYSGLPIYTSSTPALLNNQYAPGTYTTNFKIAAKAGNSQIAGDYTNVINFTATTFPSPLSLEEAYAYNGKEKVSATDPNTGVTGQYYTMQDMNSGICAMADMGSELNVTDVRDQSIYLIGKLKDGRCWLKDNLRLDPTDPTTASRMSETNTNAPAAAITNYLNGSEVAPEDGWSTVAVADVDSDFNYFNKPRINNASVNTEVIGYGSTAFDGRTRVGIYYNYCAATIGTYCYPMNSGDVVYHDVCPRNWKIPTGGANSEYYITGYSTNATDKNSLQANLSTPLSGHYFSNSAYEQNNRGVFWSSTSYDFNNMYILFIKTSEVGFVDYGNRAHGRPIRCIAK